VHRPELSNELSTIIMTALAQDPDQRFQTADDLRASLDAYAGRMATTVQPAQIASYLRRMFGDRPEPWLEVQDGDADELAPTTIGRLSTSSLSLSMPALSTDQIVRVHAQPADSVAIASSTDRRPSRRRSLVLGGAAFAVVAAAASVAVATSGDRLVVADAPVVAYAPRPVAPAPPAPPLPISEPYRDEVVPDSAPRGVPVVRATVVTARAPQPRAALQPEPRAKPSRVVEEPPVTMSRREAPKPVDEPRPVAHDAGIAATAAIAPSTPPAPKPIDDHPPPAIVPSAPSAPVPPLVPQIPELSNEMIGRIASLHGRELAQCENGAVLHGEIVVRFETDANGQVHKPQVQIRGITNMPMLSACVLRSVMGWRFAKQGADGARGTYTLSFQ
jgi:hypothetical protein